jgi:hypothetical protein
VIEMRKGIIIIFIVIQYYKNYFLEKGKRKKEEKKENKKRRKENKKRKKEGKRKNKL